MTPPPVVELLRQIADVVIEHPKLGLAAVLSPRTDDPAKSASDWREAASDLRALSDSLSEITPERVEALRTLMVDVKAHDLPFVEPIQEGRCVALLVALSRIAGETKP